MEINHASILASEASLGEELDITRRAYHAVLSENHDLVKENNVLRDEVVRLVAALEAREKQFFAETGKNSEEEEF